MKALLFVKKIKWGAVLLSILAVIGCNAGNKQSSADYPPDNSGRNQRDGKPGTPTPEAQKENDADLGITEKIRQAVIADDSLSMTAKNVKIITANGMVTIRGPVNSEQERDNIAQKAIQIAGLTKVDNQLEITTTH